MFLGRLIMLYGYGSMLPIRILDEIQFWKNQEFEHTEFIKALISNLEIPYVNLLTEWAMVFKKSELTARTLLDQSLSSNTTSAPFLPLEIEQLLSLSCLQSREFIRQLYSIKDQSGAIRENSLANTVLLHIIRESDYFLHTLDTLIQPGIFQNQPLQPTTSHSKEEKVVHLHTSSEAEPPIKKR